MIKEIIEQIDRMFPWASKKEPASLSFHGQDRLSAFLALIEGIPLQYFKFLSPDDIIIRNASVGAIKHVLSVWQSGNGTIDSGSLVSFGNFHPVHLIREVLLKCPDEIQPETFPLTFLEDDVLRKALVSDIENAKKSRANFEWTDSTLSSIRAIDGILLAVLSKTADDQLQRAISQAIKDKKIDGKAPSDLNLWNFVQRVEVATQLELITEATAKQCRTINDHRGLIHAGYAERKGYKFDFDEGTAASAWAGVLNVNRDLSNAGNR